MQEKLIIYLHAKEPDHPSWVVLDTNGIIKETHYQGESALLADLAADRADRIVEVIVPAEDVLLTHTVLQKMGRARLLQVLPFALEERLIDDVDKLHFAIGVEEADGHLPVAVVSQNKIKQWQDLLSSMDITPDSMMPSIFLLPWQKETWHVMVLDDMVLMRTGLTQGIACDPINFPHILNLALAETKWQPQQIVLHDDRTALPSSSFPHLTFLQQEGAPEKFLSDASAQLMASAPIDLLQGAYAAKRSGFMQMNNIMKTTAYLLGIWIGLILVYPLFSYFLLKSRSNETNVEISRLYKYHFPKAGSMIAPKMRMAEKLEKLKNQTGDQPLLTYLNAIGQGIIQIPAIKLKRVDYQQRQMTVELTAATSQDFSAFTDFLQKQGLTVKQQNANLSGTQMNATLLIE